MPEPITIYCRGTRANGKPCARILAVQVGGRLLVTFAGREYRISGTLEEVRCEKCLTRSHHAQLVGRPA